MRSPSTALSRLPAQGTPAVDLSAPPCGGLELLEHWLGWASRSRLASFVVVADRIATHIEALIATLEYRLECRFRIRNSVSVRICDSAFMDDYVWGRTRTVKTALCHFASSIDKKAQGSHHLGADGEQGSAVLVGQMHRIIANRRSGRLISRRVGLICPDGCG